MNNLTNGKVEDKTRVFFHFYGGLFWYFFVWYEKAENKKFYVQKPHNKNNVFQPYKESVAQVVRAFQLEIEEEDGRRNDIQGELMQRELAERQQALKNLAILSKSNEELKLLRYPLHIHTNYYFNKYFKRLI